MEKAKVYFTEEITPEALQRIYHALGVSLKVKELSGTIVECNTAYKGRRNTSAAHWQTMKDHGFMDIAPCDLMDEHGEMSLPVAGGKRLKENFVGENLKNYDSMLMLSHFKGHPMAGLGGALKNMSIGVASAHGKQWIHTSGSGETSFKALMNADHDGFLESMADADESVMTYMGRENIVYINVANRLSVDCDCCASPADPEMMDIGIFASLDPVAVDQACVDAVYASKDPGKAALIERMESRNGILTVEAAAQLGLGVREYEIVNI